MTETEKSTRTIAEFENEVEQLTADVADLEQRLSTATVAAEQAIATAERRADDSATAAAVDAEDERDRLAAALSRRRLALTAATADLQAARHGLTESQKAAAFVKLQTILDSLTFACVAIDENPTEPSSWATINELISQAQSIWVSLGGRTRLIEKPAAVRGRLWASLGVHVDWALGLRKEELKPVPSLGALLELPSAAGRVREMMSA